MSQTLLVSTLGSGISIYVLKNKFANSQTLPRAERSQRGLLVERGAAVEGFAPVKSDVAETSRNHVCLPVQTT